MRLINTSTLLLEEFIQDIPPYAILSHRWEAGEVTFQDYSEVTNTSRLPNDDEIQHVEEKSGYQKIQSFCEVALSRGLHYAWVDTCCINKHSSAELSEAINSMGRWYEDADVCIVYLTDVSSLIYADQDRDIFHQLEDSAWFTRGWTLQELLNPRRLEFYSASWERIGSLDKDDALLGQAYNAPLNLSPPRRSFLSSLERASRMKIDDLCIADNYQSASIAQRMFWASHRVTTKEEDMSYCLFALFSVAMPLIYGEGSSKSFTRLQMEIMSGNTDESVFAWMSRKDRVSNQPHPYDGNVLAASPADFGDSNDIERTPLNLDRALVLNGNGIDIYRDSDSLCVFRRQQGDGDEQLLFLINLGCERTIPDQLSDPCVIALVAEIKRNLSGSNARGENTVPPVTTIRRRIMSETLSSVNVSGLKDMGYELLEARTRRQYHLWLPFENILPGGEERRRLRERRRRSRL